MKNKAIFLIQIFLWLSMALSVGMPKAMAVAAPSQDIQTVQSLEDTLYAVHYDQDSLNDRVNRLEETVFGQAQSGSNIEARITKLQGSLSPKALGPLSPVNKTANAATGTDSSKTPNNQSVSTPATKSSNFSRGTSAISAAQGGNGASQQIAYNNGTSNNPGKYPTSSASSSNSTVAASPEPGETDYPTVTQMEQKQFGRTFTKEDITQRLARLENQVFKTPQTGSLADRTDNLRMVVLGDVGQQGQPTVASNSYGYGGGNNGYNNASYSQPDPTSGYGYPQPPNYGGPNYGGYSNIGGGSAPYGGPPQSMYGYGSMQGYHPGSNFGLPNNIASAGPNTGGMSPMPGYGGGPANNSGSNYQPSDKSINASTPDMLSATTEVEKEVLGKTYPSEPINARLDRLENKVFKTTSPEMSPQDRLQRVIAVASAGGSPMNNKAKAKATFQVLLPIILTILPLVLL